MNGSRKNFTLGHFPATSLADARVNLLEKKAANKDGSLITDKELKIQEKLIKGKQEAKSLADSITLGEVMDEFILTIIKKTRLFRMFFTRLQMIYKFGFIL